MAGTAGSGSAAAPGNDGAPAGAGGLRHIYSGKVRELYQAGDGVLLLVATDRISAFDFVLDTPIPDKGKILTQLSLWWFERLADIVPNHLVDAPVPAEFAGRAMACMPLTMVPVECVARGYLTGSGLADYRRDGAVWRGLAARRADGRVAIAGARVRPGHQGAARVSTTRTSPCPAGRTGRRAGRRGT